MILLVCSVTSSLILLVLQDEEGRREAVEWFEEGEKLGCPFSAYELWKSTSQQPLVRNHRERRGGGEREEKCGEGGKAGRELTLLPTSACIFPHPLSQFLVDEVQSVRKLRRIVSTCSVGGPMECLEAMVHNRL